MMLVDLSKADIAPTRCAAAFNQSNKGSARARSAAFSNVATSFLPIWMASQGDFESMKYTAHPHGIGHRLAILASVPRSLQRPLT